MSKVKGRGKQMPRGEARPLGMPKAKNEKQSARTEANRVGQKEVVDSAASGGVDSVQTSEPQAIPQAASTSAARDQQPQEKTMTLTLKNLSKNGKNAFYAGAATTLRFALSAFPSRQAPTSFTVSDGIFAEPKTAKAAMTVEEKAAAKAARAALPKPTLAERIAKREAQLAKDKAKLQAQSASL